MYTELSRLVVDAEGSAEANRVEETLQIHSISKSLENHLVEWKTFGRSALAFVSCSFSPHSCAVDHVCASGAAFSFIIHIFFCALAHLPFDDPLMRITRKIVESGKIDKQTSSENQTEQLNIELFGQSLAQEQNIQQKAHVDEGRARARANAGNPQNR